MCVNSFPNDKFLDSSKLKKFADDNFRLDEKGRKLSKWVENTVGKGKIARYEQFLLFPLCFQKPCTAETWALISMETPQKKEPTIIAVTS